MRFRESISLSALLLLLSLNQPFLGQDMVRTGLSFEFESVLAPQTTETLGGAISPSLPPADPLMQRDVAGRPGVKIGIDRSGLVRVSATELVAAGFDIGSDSTNWQLFSRGTEVPIIVGEGNGFIEFLGVSVETPESRETIYFLVVGDVPGKRIKTRKFGRLSAPVDNPGFYDEYFRKNRAVYVTTVLNRNAENFFGEVINTSGSNIGFSLPGLLTGTVEIEIKVQGLTEAVHKIKPTLNGGVLESIDGANRESFTKKYFVDSSALLESGNTLNLKSELGSSDISLLDHLKIRFRRSYKANADRLWFETTDYKKSDATGFSEPGIRIFDFTYPGVVSELGNIPTLAGKSGFGFRMPSYRKGKYFATTSSGLITASSIASNTPSNLGAGGNAAEFVVITHSNWLALANQWAAFRANDGFSTKVIDVEDVFDEFGYGQPTADSIKAFLDYANANWATPPQYVLLLGDGTYDPKNIGGQGFANYVPAKLVDTAYEETASDDALADFDGDGLAELKIGRVPIRSATEGSAVLAKLQQFESGLANAPSRGSLCVSDLNSGYDFQMLCQNLQDELPATIPKTSINRGDAGARTSLLSQINSNRYLVNYSGHGSSTVWATSTFFGVNDVPALANDEPSLFTMLTCLNGYFIRPSLDSLSEALLKKGTGGAVAVWSSSGTTTPDVQEVMATGFYSQLLNAKAPNRLGALANDAKATLSAGNDVRLSWVLLGDPATKVR
ncbi:MAG: C25 family cysteine peptidase [Pyrinomonadaceae bacterium]